MSVFYLLIPVSVAVAAGFVLICVMAIRSGQFDDLESPRWRVLFDEKKTEAPNPSNLNPAENKAS